MEPTCRAGSLPIILSYLFPVRHLRPKNLQVPFNLHSHSTVSLDSQMRAVFEDPFQHLSPGSFSSYA